MKRNSLYAFWALVLVSIACSSSFAEPTPTVTPDPPTFTPTPTETLTPIPTATRNSTATAAFISTQSAGYVLDEIKEMLGDTDIPYQGGSLLWQQRERYDIQLSGPEARYIPFAENLKGKNFILKSDVTWNASGILICGILFRSEKNLQLGKQYGFIFMRFSGAPAWAIEYYEFGLFKNSPTGVQYSSAVDLANGATNRFLLIANEGEFTVFINDIRQGRFFDNSKQRSEGDFAFLGSQDSGDGMCEYENSWVWELK